MTLRVRAGLPSLRRRDLFEVVKACLQKASRDDFRVVHFSVQRNHLHLIVEAADGRLSPGVIGLCVRIARQVNRAVDRRGTFWDDRYHTRELASPREVRNAYVYVLMNAKKHHADAPAIDPCSSAPWFDGFSARVVRPPDPPPVRRSRTWLGNVGWRCHGLIHPSERPKPN